jgi:hypothetical protein
MMSTVVESRFFIGECDELRLAVKLTAAEPGQFAGMPDGPIEQPCLVAHHDVHVLRPASEAEFVA